MRQSPLVQTFDGELRGCNEGHLLRFSLTNPGGCSSNLGGNAQGDNRNAVNIAVKQIAVLDLNTINNYRAIELNKPGVAMRWC
jgi:hypothetical protein